MMDIYLRRIAYGGAEERIRLVIIQHQEQDVTSHVKIPRSFLMREM
jgi:hypothetical protein